MDITYIPMARGFVSMGWPVSGRPNSNTDRPFGRLAPQGVPVRLDPHSDRPVRVFPWTCRPPGTPCG